MYRPLVDHIPACTVQGGCIPACTGKGVSTRGVSAQGVVYPGGVSAQEGVCLGQCLCHPQPPGQEAETPLNRMTDRQVQKHYLAGTSLRAVKICFSSFGYIYPIQPMWVHPLKPIPFTRTTALDVFWWKRLYISSVSECQTLAKWTLTEW